VKKWTKNVDIFNKDFLLVPVNYKLHWSLGIVCFPGAVLEEKITTKRRCCILGFDSLSKFRRTHFNEIKRYLNMAWSARIKSSVRQFPFTEKSCACISLETPAQRNGKGCGVFVLHNCESFFDAGGFPDYTKPSPGVNWYRSSDIRQKRIIIHKLISEKCGLDLNKKLLRIRTGNLKRKE
jgi:sentrin-specific protease 7